MNQLQSDSPSQSIIQMKNDNFPESIDKSTQDYIDTGRDLYIQGNYIEAISNFDEAIRLDPNSAEAYSGRGTSKYYIT